MDGRAGLEPGILGFWQSVRSPLGEREGISAVGVAPSGFRNKHKLETKKRKDMDGTTGNLSSPIAHAITGRLGWRRRYSVLRASSAEWSVLMQCCALCPNPPSASPLYSSDVPRKYLFFGNFGFLSLLHF